MDPTGKSVEQSLEAADEDVAQEMIRASGLFVTGIGLAPNQGGDRMKADDSMHNSANTGPGDRQATIIRATNETKIELTLCLDGEGKHQNRTGIGFFDHMLDLFARHGAFDLQVNAVGDLHVDQHHTVEDTGICLGEAFQQSLGDKRGIRRYGHFSLPMEDSLANVAIDFGGRPYFAYSVDFPSAKIGDFDSELVREFWQAFVSNAQCNLHINVLYGINSHHISEAIFKATARAARMATEADPRMLDVPSTKGKL